MVFVLASLPGAVAAAQLTASIGPSALSSAGGVRPGWETLTQMGGGLQLDFARLSLDAAGAVQRRAGRADVGFLAIDPIFRSSSFGPLRVVATGRIHSTPPSAALQPPSSALAASLVASHGSLGAFTGPRAEVGALPSWMTGMWKQIGSRLVLSVNSALRRTAVGGRPSRFWTETHYDSTWTDTSGWQHFPVQRPHGDSGVAATRLNWLETEGRLSWVTSRLVLDATVGYRPRVDSIAAASWMTANASLAIGSRVALTAGVGTNARRGSFASSAGRFGTVGVRLTRSAALRPAVAPEIVSVASAFSVARDTSGESLIRVRLPTARVVEISGDFNNWTPIRLKQRAPNVWEVAVALKPGVYRMNLRVDGTTWVAPPGITAVDDDFNGRVGIVVIPDSR